MVRKKLYISKKKKIRWTTPFYITSTWIEAILAVATKVKCSLSVPKFPGSKLAITFLLFLLHSLRVVRLEVWRGLVVKMNTKNIHFLDKFKKYEKWKQSKDMGNILSLTPQRHLVNIRYNCFLSLIFILNCLSTSWI